MRTLREEHGLTVKYVAVYLGVDFGVLARFERGEQALPRDAIAALLDVYQVFDRGERDVLLRWAQHVWRPSREVDFDGVIADEPFVDLLWLESEATTIGCYSPLSIPDLLHSAGYVEHLARALSDGNTVADEQIAARVALAAQRRQRLGREPYTVDLTVVLDECVLRHPPRNRPAWDGQLHHLQQTAALPGVSLQILPTGADRPPGVDSGFTIFTLPHPYPPTVVHIPYFGGRLFVDDGCDRYQQTLTHLCTAALDTHETADLLANRL
ncbi:helix-turn-helix transcriptional regulator [Micromonospora sp. CPCC 205371]|nr:helix-turn-helix transcriptional regulator [Micromonospora sp. CPCC 205371]